VTVSVMNSATLGYMASMALPIQERVVRNCCLGYP